MKNFNKVLRNFKWKFSKLWVKFKGNGKKFKKILIKYNILKLLGKCLVNFGNILCKISKKYSKKTIKFVKILSNI